jgi:hypothetical protein
LASNPYLARLTAVFYFFFYIPLSSPSFMGFCRGWNGRKTGGKQYFALKTGKKTDLKRAKTGF